MLATPIFDQVRADLPEAPLCPICRHVNFTPNTGDICGNCWMRRPDDPDNHAKWHCADCGEYIDELERHLIVTQRQMERYEAGTDGILFDTVYLCREHYDARTKASALGQAQTDRRWRSPSGIIWSFENGGWGWKYPDAHGFAWWSKGPQLGAYQCDSYGPFTVVEPIHA